MSFESKRVEIFKVNNFSHLFVLISLTTAYAVFHVTLIGLGDRVITEQVL